VGPRPLKARQRGRPFSPPAALESAEAPRHDGHGLVVADLSKHYGNRTAVRGVSLHVRPGTVHGLVGPNGSGKTTVLRSVLGLVEPDAGTIRVLGGERQHAARRPRGGLAGLVDDPRFYPYLTAHQNLELLTVLDGGDADRSGRVGAVLERVGLAETADRKVAAFSLGMRQRLGLAAALLRRPRVLLLDEPANGLDPAATGELWQVVRELAADGGAVLLSSHDLAAIDEVCDAVTVLRHGEVAWSGPLAQLRAQAPAPESLLATSDDAMATAIAVRLGVPVADRTGGVRITAATHALDELTVALGQARIAIRSLTPGASPLRTLFAQLTEGTSSPLSSDARDDPPGPVDSARRPVATSRRRRRSGAGDVAAVCAVEARKLVAQTKLRLLIAACLVAPFAFAAVVRLSGNLPSDTLYGRWVLQSGAALPLVVLAVTASWAFPLLTSVVAGDSFAAEDRLGTWPTLLTRSRPASAIVTGKCVVAATAAVGAVALLGASAVAAGILFAGWAPLVGLSGTLLPAPHAFALVALAWAATLPAALAWTSFALLLSAATRNAVVGIGVPALLGVVLQLAWIVDAPPLVRELLPSAALDSWHNLFETPASAGPLLGSIAVAIAWGMLGVAGLATVLRRRDAVGG
jgi:ABC-2 type transport system ATP-binding protein